MKSNKKIVYSYLFDESPLNFFTIATNPEKALKQLSNLSGKLAEKDKRNLVNLGELKKFSKYFDCHVSEDGFLLSNKANEPIQISFKDYHKFVLYKISEYIEKQSILMNKLFGLECDFYKERVFFDYFSYLEKRDSEDILDF